MIPLFSLVLAAAVGWPVPVAACDYEAERAAVVDADGATLLRVLARSGALVVEGRRGATEVRVRGRACASDPELLEAIRLDAGRDGAEALVEAVLPETGGWDDAYARLDLVIEAPAGIAAEIRDSSGEMEVRGVGALRVDDGSGEVRIEDIAGPVHVDDNSGELYVAGVNGDVEIEDGSGEIEVHDVQGSVTLEDGSGPIRVEGVVGGVLVRRDGSGSIRVAGVEGDFVVERDGSGDVSHRDVRGVVRIAGN